MTTGLILGKFAPLHRGHQFVIETALREMDNVIVLIYDVPETTTIPLPVRRKWIEALYPKVQVLEAWDGPVEVSADPQVTALHDAYLKKRLAAHPITHFYCSEFYGAHVSVALNAVDRRVDPLRSKVSVSGTAVRTDPFGNREYLEPCVYRDHLVHVVFVGAPSTGKTTIAKALAGQYGTCFVPEYGREYWEKNHVNRRLTRDQLVDIAIGHRALEESLVMSARDLLFIDTDATTTANFSYAYHDFCDHRLEQLASEVRTRYDLRFLCMPDFPHEDTWDRSGSVFRDAFQRRIEADLITRRLPYIRLRGTVDERMSVVKQTLANFQKFARS